MMCPKCGSENIDFQVVNSGSIGAAQNSVVIQKPKKHKGLLYWLFIGWWLVPMYWLCIGWWVRLFFGGGTKKGWNLNASKTFNSTMAICQSCGHSWKTK